MKTKRQMGIGGSAFYRVWLKTPPERRAKVSKRQAQYWMNEGFKELNRIQNAKLARKTERENTASNGGSRED